MDRGGYDRVGTTDMEGARRQVDLCLDAGINLIDTADAYSDGHSEEILGAALKGRRDQVLIATKVRFRVGPGPNDEGLSRHRILSGCDASLRRLGTDYIDLYQLHDRSGSVGIHPGPARRDIGHRGCRTIEQLSDNLAAADLVLTAEERQRLDDVSAIPLLYPYWHQAKLARNRLSPADRLLLGPHL